MNCRVSAPGHVRFADDAGVVVCVETGQHGIALDGRPPMPPARRRIPIRSANASLDDVMNIVHTQRMTKRLQAIGNSAGIIIDRPILDLLGITQKTDLDIKTDGKRLIITPLESEPSRRGRLAKVQARALHRHAETFRKLAK